MPDATAASVSRRPARAPRGAEVRRLRADDRDALPAFQRACFGEGARQADPAWFRWAYEDTPWRAPEGSAFWVCRAGDAIVGQQGALPFRLKAGDREVDAAWPVDLMVAPEWRLRLVGPALSEAQAATCDIAVALNVSDAAARAYRTAGWLDLGAASTLARVIDAPACAAIRDSGRRGLRGLAFALTPALRAMEAAWSGYARLTGTRTQPAAAFDGRVDAVWRDACGAYPVLARRDARFLQWRFDQTPDAGDNLRRLVVRGDRAVGYFVLRLDRTEAGPVAVLLDYLAAPAVMPALLAHAVAAARKAGGVALVTRTLNTRAARAFLAQGFVTLPEGVAAPTRMMIRLGGPAADLAPLLGDPRSWLVTAADSDIGIRRLSL